MPGGRTFIAVAVGAAVLSVGVPATPATRASAAPVCTPGAKPITGLKTAEKVVTFTFDDGPSSVFTRPIMDAFESRGLTATFFVVSAAARAQPDLAREMVARGFELGNHSRTHHYDAATNVKEMPVAERQIEEASGFHPIFFRMPGLAWRASVIRATGKYGLCAVHTGIELGDWKAKRPSAETLCNRFKAKLRPGTLLVLHDGGKSHGGTVAAVPCMLDHAIAQGYRVLGLRDFLALASSGQATITYRPG